MAPLNKAKLVREAKKEGYSTSDLRGKSAQEIQDMLSGGTKRVVKKKSTVQKKRTTRPVSRKRTTRKPKSTPRKRKSTTRSTGNGHVNSTDGRHVLTGVNYKKRDGWNPREDSAPDRIVKALARFKGDREKVFNHLKSDRKDFVGTRRGKKYSKPEAEQMLRYRISRTAWQFALATGQHKVATDRAEYGKGGTGEGVFKRKRGGSPRSTTTTTRKKKSATKKKVTGRSQKAPKRTSDNGVSGWSDAKLKRYLKSYEGKRGRRPAEYADAVKLAKQRKIAV